NHLWLISVGRQAAAAQANFSTPFGYQLPTLASTSLAQFNTAGVETFTLTGTNLGPAWVAAIYSLTYQGSSLGAPLLGATSCSVSVAHTQATCALSAGVGTLLQFTLRVQDQSSVATASGLSYRPPTWAGIDSTALAMHTPGGESLTVSGTELGPAATSGF